MSDLCRHELDPRACGSCLGLAEAVNTWEAAGTFEAQYSQSCADMSCRKRIEEGDLVTRWIDGGYTAYTHKGCRP